VPKAAALIDAAQNNMRTAWGRTQSVAGWAAEWVIPVLTLVARLERGLCLEESLTGSKPPAAPSFRSGRLLTADGETLTMGQWAERAGIAVDTLDKRLKSGWDVERAVTAPRMATNRPVGERYAIRAGEPGSWSWYELPFERDAYAQEFVTLHPDGANMSEVGAAMGVEVSWICEMERGALKKLRALVDDGEITEAELVAALEVFADHAPEEWDGGGPIKAVAHEWGAKGTGDESARAARGERRDEPVRWQDVPDVADDAHDEGDERDQGDEHGQGQADDRAGGDRGEATGAARATAAVIASGSPWRKAGNGHLSPREAARIKRWAASSSRVSEQALKWG
jgi:hypothetical protein